MSDFQKKGRGPTTNNPKLSFTSTGNIILGKSSFHLLLPLLFLTAYLGNYLLPFSLCWGIALLHELTHILVAFRLGVPTAGIGIHPFGVSAKLKDPIIKSPVKEIVIALAGPFFNLALTLLLHIICKKYPFAWLWYSKNTSLALGLFNLLPCLPLDGGRILRATLTLGSDAISAWQTALRISRLITIILFGVATFLLLTTPFQFSLLLISAFLLGNLCLEEKSISHQALRELLYYKEKPEREEFNSTSVLTAYQSLPARKLLRKLSYHKYYQVQVLDDKQKIIATLTESQILDALLNQSIRIKLGEIR